MLVKKLSAILLLFIYSFASVGATVYIHYCMDERVGSSLFRDKEKKCGNCGMDKDGKKDCCKNEKEHLQLKVEHQKPVVLSSLCNIFATLSSSYLFTVYKYSSEAEASFIDQPQIISKLKLHILFSVYLI